jgi:hypothetical protein
MGRLAIIGSMILAPAVALAGAWTWPKGTGQAILSLTAGEGDYDGRSGAGAAHETRLASSLDLEYGLDDRVTAVVEGGFEDYAIAAPVADAYRGLDYSAAGLRARLLSSESFVWSVQGTGLVPGARNPLRPAQAGNTGFDTDWRTLVGSSFVAAGWPSFADAEFGYRTRAGGPPGEWLADLTLGFRPRPDLTIMAQAFASVSNGMRPPEFPAAQALVVEPSLVYDFNQTWSAQVGVYASLRAVNANRENGVVAALWRRF